MMSYLIFGCVVAVTIFETVSAQNGIPLKVSVYYESHCPDSRDFIMQQLHPHFCKVQQYLNLNLVPFGKARSTEKEFECQHGAKECRGNTIHNCVLKRILDSITQVDYVNCAMYNPELPGHIEKTPLESLDDLQSFESLDDLQCAENNGVSFEQVHDCYISGEGTDLMLKAEIETKNMTPGPKFVPTIVFDDAYNDKDQNQAFKDFESTICEKLVARGYTDVCSNGRIINQETC